MTMLVVVVSVGFLFLLVLLVISTIQGKGRWGINPVPMHCPNCGLALPVVRKPSSWGQALWGGWTCTGCGAEMDKWGKLIGDGLR